MPPMPIPPSLANRPGALLVIAARTGQELARRRLAPVGLSVQQCGVLNVLAEGPVSQQKLGQQLGIDRTTIVSRHRNPTDRRSYALSLTPRGRTAQKRAAKVFDAAADEFFAPLKPVQRQAMQEMLRQMITSADRHLEESSP
jgi:DNA-binding MarR family transcriptional regulator